MRALLVIVLIAALGWSGYWWIGSTAHERALTGWLEEQRTRGWVAEAESLHVTGYPNRFDTIITDLDLADPFTGWSWNAPEFQILSLSYKPTHVIAVWPGVQTIASPAERIAVSARQMRGSVRLAANTRLSFEEARIELEAVGLNSTLGWQAALAEGQFAMRAVPEGSGPENAYDVSLRARALRLPEYLRNRLDPAGLLPDAVERADIRLTPVFTAPWDRISVEYGPPQMIALNVGNVSFAWGPMQMTVTGRLDADERGFAEGSLNVIARNWQDMLDMAVRSGWLAENMRTTVETALALLAQGTGETRRLDMTITYRGGRAWLGLIPLGPAPRLHDGLVFSSG